MERDTSTTTTEAAAAAAPAAAAPAAGEGEEPVVTATLDRLLSALKDPIACSRNNATFWEEIASPTTIQDIARQVTCQQVLDELLPAVFARTDSYQHLTVGLIPPGCEHVRKYEWEKHFDTDKVDVSPDDVDTRFIDAADIAEAGSFQEAVHDHMNSIHDERVSHVQWNIRERDKEWKRDEIKGLVVKLLREWMQQHTITSTEIPNMQTLAAQEIALRLFPTVITAPNERNNDDKPVASVLKYQSYSALNAYLQEELGGDDPRLEAARVSVMDHLIPYMICWEFCQDFFDCQYSEFARYNRLPGIVHTEGSNMWDNGWWEDYGMQYVTDSMLPASSVAFVLSLSTLLLHIAKERGSGDCNDYVVEKIINALLPHCSKLVDDDTTTITTTATTKCLCLALPAIKANFMQCRTPDITEECLDLNYKEWMKHFQNLCLAQQQQSAQQQQQQSHNSNNKRQRTIGTLQMIEDMTQGQSKEEIKRVMSLLFQKQEYQIGAGIASIDIPRNIQECINLLEPSRDS